MTIFILLVSISLSVVQGSHTDCDDCFMVSFPRFFEYITECPPETRVMIINTFVENANPNDRVFSNFDMQIKNNNTIVYNVTDISYFQVNRLTFDVPLLTISISCPRSGRCILLFLIKMKCMEYTQSDNFFTNYTSSVYTINYSNNTVYPTNVVFINVDNNGNYTTSEAQMSLVTSNAIGVDSSLPSQGISFTTIIIVGAILTVVGFVLPSLTFMYCGKWFGLQQ